MSSSSPALVIGLGLSAGLVCWAASLADGRSAERARRRRDERLHEAQRRARVLLRLVEDPTELAGLAAATVEGFQQVSRTDGRTTETVDAALRRTVAAADGGPARDDDGRRPGPPLPRIPRMGWTGQRRRPERTAVAHEVRADGGVTLTLVRPDGVRTTVLLRPDGAEGRAS